VINEVQGEWEAALPEEVKEVLDASRALNKDRFIGNVVSRLAATVRNGEPGAGGGPGHVVTLCLGGTAMVVMYVYLCCLR
jgi:hypothetical protein